MLMIQLGEDGEFVEILLCEFVFFVDIFGLMWGVKMEQVKLCMRNMFGQCCFEDCFQIVIFVNVVYKFFDELVEVNEQIICEVMVYNEC